MKLVNYLTYLINTCILCLLLVFYSCDKNDLIKDEILPGLEISEDHFVDQYGINESIYFEGIISDNYNLHSMQFYFKSLFENDNEDTIRFITHLSPLSGIKNVLKFEKAIKIYDKDMIEKQQSITILPGAYKLYVILYDFIGNWVVKEYDIKLIQQAAPKILLEDILDIYNRGAMISCIGSCEDENLINQIEISIITLMDNEMIWQPDPILYNNLSNNSYNLNYSFEIPIDIEMGNYCLKIEVKNNHDLITKKYFPFEIR